MISLKTKLAAFTAALMCFGVFYLLAFIGGGTTGHVFGVVWFGLGLVATMIGLDA